MIYCFGDYVLDPDLFELRCDGAAVALEPQVFDVLSYLVQNHERVVPKQELLDHIWPERYITEAALNSRLMTARKAIGDSGREQRLIKTLHGRGYRFIGEISTHEADGAGSGGSGDQQLSAQPVPTPQAPPVASAAGPGEALAGRESESAALRRHLERAMEGHRQVVFVTGEAGLGKTTLVSAFVESAEVAESAWVAHGQCLDYHGATEPYLPILDALGRLCRSNDGAQVRQTLASVAPSWLLQMPWLVEPSELQMLVQRATGATRERMLRELTEALDVLAAARPLVLVLEDLQWSDSATVDVIASIARRPEQARLLLLGTCRLAELNATGHPLRKLHDDLRIRAQCADIAASYLGEEAIASYLAGRFGSELSARIAPVLHRRTRGSPLFMRMILDGWIEDGRITEESGTWRCSVPPDELSRGIPETMRALIALQVDGLDDQTRTMLGAAAVAGSPFAARAVAAGCDLNEEGVEIACESLASTGTLLVEQGLVQYPGGAASAQFEFSHDLVREVVYDLIPTARRARLHLAVGNSIEQLYGSESASHAAELSVHFTEGRDGRRAVRYLLQAAQLSMSRSAQFEAIGHLRSALRVLDEHPGLPEHREREMEAQGALGVALIATAGFAPPEAEQSLIRALELARELEDHEQEANCVYGLAALYEYRGEHPSANRVLRSLSGLPSPSAPVPSLPYHALMSCCDFHEGRFQQAVEEGLQSARLGVGNSDLDVPMNLQTILGEHPLVGRHEWAGQALWFLGQPDAALEDSIRGLEIAQRPGLRYSLAGMLVVMARVHQLRREPAQVADYCARTLSLAAEHGYPYHEAVAVILDGWARTMIEPGSDSGISQIRRGLDMHRDTGAGIDRPYFVALLADALLARSDYEAALQAIEAAFALWPPDRPLFYLPEMHRLRGEALLALGDREAARADLARALETATVQDALGLALRAAVSLARVIAGDGEPAKAHKQLKAVYDRFSEGFETPDLRDARELLESLDR